MATTLAPEQLAALSKDEILRYSRHLIMPEVGMEGQQKLKAAKVLTIGAGGLGSPLGLYLAAAGVGTLGLVDFDIVDESNLHRQVLFGRTSVGKAKTQAATERLRDVNPHIQVIPYETRLDSSNALELFKDYDVIVDGTDNFPTRYLVNDACVLLASRTSTARSSASRARCRSSGGRTAPATAASSPSRRRRGWSPPAPKGA